jgi:hypothetical protein
MQTALRIALALLMVSLACAVDTNEPTVAEVEQGDLTFCVIAGSCTNTAQCPDCPDGNPTYCSGSSCALCGREGQPCCPDIAGGCQQGSCTQYGKCHVPCVPTPEICDYKDNNCNGLVDEGFGVYQACDGPDGDYCMGGTRLCNGQGGTYCTDPPDTYYEVCGNGIDDDCNGWIDEYWICPAPPAGCAHPESQQGGALQNGCSVCVTTVCSSDSYCCNNYWDGICVNEAASWCGGGSPPGGSCPKPNAIYCDSYCCGFGDCAAGCSFCNSCPSSGCCGY